MRSALTFSILVLVLAGCGRPSASAGQHAPQPAPKLAAEAEQGASSPAGEPPAPDSTRTIAPHGREVVVLAGGCFWGMEDLLRQIDGVVETEVGYAGGSSTAATYERVKTGTTGHAESVRVVYDPARLTFRSLLKDWFFKMHDPTTRDRQGNDVGSQYRSAVFATTEAQASTARSVIAEISKSGAWQAPLVTEVRVIEEFVPAESYHQDYLQKNPDGYTCHYLRDLSF